MNPFVNNSSAVNLCQQVFHYTFPLVTLRYILSNFTQIIKLMGK